MTATLDMFMFVFFSPHTHTHTQDQLNGYSCDCIPGYTGSDCETEINECQPDPCENGATCNVCNAVFGRRFPPFYHGFLVYIRILLMATSVLVLLVLWVLIVTAMNATLTLV